MSESDKSRNSAKRQSLSPCGCQAVALIGILLFLFGIALGPISPGIKNAPQSSAMQTAHTLGMAMYGYANDNSDNYPDGESSTEVFQQLLDGGYVADPSIFYIPAAGKTRPVSGQKLRPENVCWDVTEGLTSHSLGDCLSYF